MKSNKMYKIILIRHGKSIWNHDSKFTGWTNIPLTKEGKQEAKIIANTMKKHKIYPSVYFSSVLDRCTETVNIIKSEFDHNALIYTSWRLNEKHYGTLEGIPRKYIRDMYGMKFTSMMRNNFYMKPPVLRNLEPSNEYPIFKNCYYNTIKYGESKENVLTRLLPYFQNDILYSFQEKKLPVVITHKHCIRVLMKYYLQLSDEEFEEYTTPHKSIIIMYFDTELNYKKHRFIKY
jgi:2,3-bisphosphoglycerate-dependent phosphoglycerate mutase